MSLPNHKGAIVTAVGMTTAVGRDAVTTAASFRAGIKRISELQYFERYDENENELVPLLGFVADPAAMGAEGLGKIVPLGVRALRDLFAQPAAVARSAQPVGVFLVLPDYAARFGDVSSDPSSDEFISSCNAHLRQRLFAGCGVDLNIKIWDCIFGAQAEYFAALAKAADAVAAGIVSWCIVGAIDSFIDSASLAWGLATERLKTEDNANGFYPGEAAVFVQLEKEGPPQRDGTMSIVLSPPNGGGASATPGVSLAGAIRGALAAAECETVGLLVGSLNGEFSRSNHWGHAVTRLVEEYPGVVQAPLLNPIEACGEIGCATVGLSIGLGIQAVKRGYANTGEILLWALSDSGAAGAMLLRNG